MSINHDKTIWDPENEKVNVLNLQACQVLLSPGPTKRLMCIRGMRSIFVLTILLASLALLIIINVKVSKDNGVSVKKTKMGDNFELVLSPPEAQEIGSDLYRRHCKTKVCDSICVLLGYKHGFCVTPNTCHCSNYLDSSVSPPEVSEIAIVGDCSHSYCNFLCLLAGYSRGICISSKTCRCYQNTEDKLLTLTYYQLNPDTPKTLIMSEETKSSFINIRITVKGDGDEKPMTIKTHYQDQENPLTMKTHDQAEEKPMPMKTEHQTTLETMKDDEEKPMDVTYNQFADPENLSNEESSVITTRTNKDGGEKPLGMNTQHQIKLDSKTVKENSEENPMYDRENPSTTQPKNLERDGEENPMTLKTYDDQPDPETLATEESPDMYENRDQLIPMNTISSFRSQTLTSGQSELQKLNFVFLYLGVRLFFY